MKCRPGGTNIVCSINQSFNAIDFVYSGNVAQVVKAKAGIGRFPIGVGREVITMKGDSGV